MTEDVHFLVGAYAFYLFFALDVGEDEPDIFHADLVDALVQLVALAVLAALLLGDLLVPPARLLEGPADGLEDSFPGTSR